MVTSDGGKLKKLVEFVHGRTYISGEQIKKLQRALPNCQIDSTYCYCPE
ncbi:hypothetical protein Pla144_19160 [Bythopirellula polymerisocia]|uniref:Uncharacterized protein n=1 Tax=Bythopirellula polymerisocia TaxID=2528003 RepID=A0A5C6CYG6_9BACT|nr:hypothetical protein Pla144_19160 [Bythopirellula polymerisocia]